MDLKRKISWVVKSSGMVVMVMLLLIGIDLAVDPLHAETGTGRLAVLSVNPHYFKDASGAPVFLIGYYGFFPHSRTGYDYLQLLNKYEADGLNYMRISFSPTQLPELGWHVYRRLDNGKFDLTQWNPEYWERLRDLITVARSKGIYVHVSVFDHMCVSISPEMEIWRWPGCAWNIDNNVNGNLFGDIDRNNNGNPLQNNEFYDADAVTGNTTNALRLNVAAHQRRFVDKVLAETAGFSNVFYELGNEVGGGSTASHHIGWQRYWLNYISTRTPAVLTLDDDHSVLNALSEPKVDASFYHHAKVSGDSLLDSWPASAYSANRAIATDTDGSPRDVELSPEINRQGAWLAFTSGGHWFNFSIDVHRSEAEYNVEKGTYYRYLRRFIQDRNIPFWTMAPNDELETTSGKGKVLANVGQEYIVYSTQGGPFNLNLTGVSGTFIVEWYNPRTGVFTSRLNTNGGAIRNFPAPFSGDAVLHVKKNQNLTISNLSKPYQVVNGLSIGDLVYTDRAYTISSAPSLVVGQQYIKTANEDKLSTGNSFFSFMVNLPVTVYVAHDDRISQKPSWLSSFTNTGTNLVTTDTTMSLYRKTFAAGTVILGGNGGATNSSMYIVIVVKQ